MAVSGGEDGGSGAAVVTAVTKKEGMERKVESRRRERQLKRAMQSRFEDGGDFWREGCGCGGCGGDGKGGIKE